MIGFEKRILSDSVLDEMKRTQRPFPGFCYNSIVSSVNPISESASLFIKSSVLVI